MVLPLTDTDKADGERHFGGQSRTFFFQLLIEIVRQVKGKGVKEHLERYEKDHPR